jgi:hypothetical protein
LHSTPRLAQDHIQGDRESLGRAKGIETHLRGVLAIDPFRSIPTKFLWSCLVHSLDDRYQISSVGHAAVVVESVAGQRLLSSRQEVLF